MTNTGFPFSSTITDNLDHHNFLLHLHSVIFLRWIGANFTNNMLSEKTIIFKDKGDSVLCTFFQLIEDYYTLKGPNLLEGFQKTQLSSEIDGKLHLEQKVHLFISYIYKSRCKLLVW